MLFGIKMFIWKHIVEIFTQAELGFNESLLALFNQESN